MGRIPTVDEMIETVERLERSLAGAPLLPLYRDLKARFRADLACGAALTLVKADLESRSSQTLGR
jgi:hypothetical protein